MCEPHETPRSSWFIVLYSTKWTTYCLLVPGIPKITDPYTVYHVSLVVCWGLAQKNELFEGHWHIFQAISTASGPRFVTQGQRSPKLRSTGLSHLPGRSSVDGCYVVNPPEVITLNMANMAGSLIATLQQMSIDNFWGWIFFFFCLVIGSLHFFGW